MEHADAAFDSGDPARASDCLVAGGLHTGSLAISSQTDLRLVGLSGHGPIYISDIVEKWRAMTSCGACLRSGRAQQRRHSDNGAGLSSSLALAWSMWDAIAPRPRAMRLPVAEFAAILLENRIHLDEANLARLTRY